jgi:hypothetical protein
MSGLGQRMTIKRKTRKAPAKRAALAQAIARHMAAQAALDAIPGPQDHPEHRCDEEDEALEIFRPNSGNLGGGAAERALI